MDMCTKVLILVATLQLILFFIFAMAFIQTQGNGYKYVTIANAFIGFAIALSIMLYNYLRSYSESATFEQMVFRKVNEHLMNVNESFRAKKLEWVLIPNHYWMELRMLDKNEKDYDTTPTHNGKEVDKFKGQNNLGIQNEEESQAPPSKSEDIHSKLFEDDEEDE